MVEPAGFTGRLRVTTGAARPEILIALRDELVARLADDFRAEAARAMTRCGSFAVALPGGSVAVHAFPALAALPLDWSRVHFFWSDERAVPPSDPESNYAIARASWFDPAHVPAAAIHRMPADGPDLVAAARDHAAELSRRLGAPPRLDYALLGVGPDGHVASLFPGHPAATDDRQSVIAVPDSPKPPTRRLTLCLPVLAGAERVVVMALGDAKASAIRAALEEPDSPLPVARLLRAAARPLVLIDPGAASALHGHGARRDRGAA